MGGLFAGSVQIEHNFAGLDPKQMMTGAASFHREDVHMTRDHLKHLIAVIEKNGAPRVDSQAATARARDRPGRGRPVIGERIAHSLVTSRV
jgi:hypothetical protein